MTLQTFIDFFANYGVYITSAWCVFYMYLERKNKKDFQKEREMIIKILHDDYDIDFKKDIVSKFQKDIKRT